ncbi:MAG: C39 family peptidase, partial [Myxococcota bacterium]|nr:C39 family peptidase [Myxococcota bacterium]
GESFDADKGFQLPYTFNSFGARKIRAVGTSEWGERVVEAVKTVTVTQRNDRADAPRGENNGNSGGLPNVPYFNQYDNYLAPSASCQNTSIAMVLAYLGWGGVPDDITQSYGKDMAQSPAGLARLFNIYASRAGLSKQIKPNTSGTFSGLRAELDRGHPVIIHGYFTSYGHVLVVLGYDENGYYVNDPAGRWSGVFMGGYSAGGSGAEVYYNKAAFEAAVGTSNGYHSLPLWYHALR